VKLVGREPAGQRDLNDPGVPQHIRNQLRNQREQFLKNSYDEVLRDNCGSPTTTMPINCSRTWARSKYRIRPLCQIKKAPSTGAFLFNLCQYLAGFRQRALFHKKFPDFALPG